MQHSRPKHIAIRHHFIHDHVAREDIVGNHVKTEDNLADIFTKPLDEKRLCVLWCELNILDFANMQYAGLGTHANTSTPLKEWVHNTQRV